MEEQLHGGGAGCAVSPAFLSPALHAGFSFPWTMLKRPEEGK